MNRIYVITNNQIIDLFEHLKTKGVERLPIINETNKEHYNNNIRRYIHIYNNKFSGWCEERCNKCLKFSTFNNCVNSYNSEIIHWKNREKKLERILKI